MDLDELNRGVIEEFRANGGKVGGPFEGMHMVLLHTVGAKSGKPRINPLAYFPDGERILIMASYAGAPTNPPWYYNLVANPEVEIEVGSERFAARARVLDEPERTEMYSRVEAAIPVFTEYRQKTSRVIPVIELLRS